MQAAEVVTENSELCDLDIRTVNGHRPTAEMIRAAIAHDVSGGIPLSKTVFLKHIAGNALLGEDALRGILSTLKEGMVNSVEVSPEVFLTYSHAAIICVTEMNARGAR